jgi:hypothetical protein
VCRRTLRISGTFRVNRIRLRCELSARGLGLGLSGSRRAAEELVQEAFLAAYRRWNQVSAYDDPAAWLRRVVVNKSVASVNPTGMGSIAYLAADGRLCGYVVDSEGSARSFLVPKSLHDGDFRTKNSTTDTGDQPRALRASIISSLRLVGTA